ncbi:MAG: hypothetical protein H6601_03510 [Flavobacteriales bacterium]|nr:hypothetical protein [Flavobacteriales bacterium]
MFRLLILVFLLSATLGCKTTEKSVAETEQAQSEKRYELIIKFETLEDVKRVPYRLSNLKMELLEEVSSTDNIYRISILCHDYALDGTIEKLNADSGIGWAKPAD